MTITPLHVSPYTIIAIIAIGIIIVICLAMFVAYTDKKTIAEYNRMMSHQQNYNIRRFTAQAALKLIDINALKLEEYKNSVRFRLHKR